METYSINKGIGRSVEFQGLKCQYLFIFAGGLLALFVLFVILYMAGEINGVYFPNISRYLFSIISLSRIMTNNFCLVLVNI